MPTTAIGICAYIACEVLYLAACIYSDTEYKVIANLEEHINEKFNFKGAKRINYLRKVNSKAYAYVVTAVKLLGNELEEMEFIK